MVERVIENFKALNQSIENVDSCCDELYSKRYGDLVDELLPIEVAKLNVALAYSAASLFYVILRCQVKNH